MSGNQEYKIPSKKEIKKDQENINKNGKYMFPKKRNRHTFLVRFYAIEDLRTKSIYPCKGLTEAALKINVSQPTLSRWLKIENSSKICNNAHYTIKRITEEEYNKLKAEKQHTPQLHNVDKLNKQWIWQVIQSLNQQRCNVFKHIIQSFAERPKIMSSLISQREKELQEIVFENVKFCWEERLGSYKLVNYL